VAYRHGFGKPVALHNLRAKALQKTPLNIGLYAFDHQLQLQCFGHLHYRLN
jgi:hypothetical protein